MGPKRQQHANTTPWTLLAKGGSDRLSHYM